MISRTEPRLTCRRQPWVVGLVFLFVGWNSLLLQEGNVTLRLSESQPGTSKDEHRRESVEMGTMVLKELGKSKY